MLDGRVLVTGGTGSLGTAILKQAKEENWPAKITALARNETKMNLIRSVYPDVQCEIGDVRDLNWLHTIFAGYDTVIHAAAIKIVPLAEASPREAVLTNIQGSLNVAQAAIEAGVKRVIGISSDKACGPTYYGLTKRLMEGVFRQANTWGDTVFVLCRYGNVLRSSNSIVPLFEEQKALDIPFTLTDDRMTRFWLSMRQAIDLILYTLDTPVPGSIVVPAAPSAYVTEIAKVIDPDREFDIIGIRPGERLHETLIIREEAMYTVREGEYFIIYPPTSVVKTNLPFHFEYTSGEPDHWLTQEEIRQLLADSS